MSNTKPFRKSTGLMMLGLCGVLQAGCAKAVTHANPDFCTVAPVFFFDDQDVLTDPTAKQLEDYLCLGIKLCGWDERGLDCK